MSPLDHAFSANRFSVSRCWDIADDYVWGRLMRHSIYRTCRLIVLVTAIPSFAQAQFLVPDQQYRCPPSQRACHPGKPTASELDLSDYNHRPFTINYVEYNDKYKYWDPQELTDAVNQVKSAADKGQVPLVVVYVHGWQNNASEESGDVVKFRLLLSRLAETWPEKPGVAAPPVAGVYLAWRGLTFTVEPFKHIVSYWPERQKAKKMGELGMQKAVCEIESTLMPLRSNPQRRQAYLILAGHSFGARVLENAINGHDASGRCPTVEDYSTQLHKLVADAKQRHAMVSEGSTPGLQLPADMIIYVNAATSSEKTKECVAQIKQDCALAKSAEICTANPLFVAFTSTNDLATGLVMPIANFVFPDLVADRFHLISAADSPWMHTHRAPAIAPSQKCPANEKICFDIVSKNREPVKYYLPRIDGRVEVSSSPQYPGGRDPFWIFNVHSNLVNGHGDVWNPNVVNMLTRILFQDEKFMNAIAVAAE
jgi:hypothetical protein